MRDRSFFKRSISNSLQRSRTRNRSGNHRSWSGNASRQLHHETLEKRELLAAEIGASCSSEMTFEANPIFAVGTTPEQVEAASQRFGSLFGSGLNERSDLSSPIIPNVNRRWVNTASGVSPNVGDTATLTWSIVPDGTQILDPNTGTSTGTSDLIAFMDGIYGGAGTPTVSDKPWFPLFEEAYLAWGRVSGLTMVYEPNDDGVPTTGSGNAGVGVLGMRGDMRIAGMNIDGNSNVLAFNYFPNNTGLSGADGDMVIDTADNFYPNNADGPTGPNRALHNVLTHEVGHGIGLSHVEPVNQTKLLEPFVSTAFRGPQEDDIWNTHILYGDALEPNDTLATAVDLGVLGNEVSRISDASIDNGVQGNVTEDRDLYQFEIFAPTFLSINLTPTGTQYDEAPQNGVPVPVDRLRESDLGFLIRDDVGNVLATVDEVGLGIEETIAEFPISSPGIYFVEVFGSEADPQLYDMDLRVGRSFDFARSDGALRLLSVNPSPDDVFSRENLNLLSSSPSELLLRFSSDQSIDEATLADGIRLVGAGLDQVLDTPDDEIIVPGHLGFADSTERIVALRFATPLGDGRYRVEVFGEDNPVLGTQALTKIDGTPFQPAENGSDRDSIDFELELGAKVVAVVPQPVIRDASGQLNQQRDVVHVYFDDNDLFAGGGTTSLSDPRFYQLIRTENTATNTDDSAFVPTSVFVRPFEQQEVPDPLNPGQTTSISVRVNRVELTFADDLNALPGGGAFRLKVGSSDPVATTTTPPEIAQVPVTSDPGGTFDTATVLPDFGNTPTLIVTESIDGQGLPFDYPGAEREPGHRLIDEQTHFFPGAEPDDTPGIERISYTFLEGPGQFYGQNAFGANLQTSISSEQKQRIREVFEIYSEQLGLDFVETFEDGIQIVVGDLFPVGRGSGVGAPFSVTDRDDELIVFDGAENWNNEYGRDAPGGDPDFFEEAIDRIGQVLDIVPVTRSRGGGEPTDLPSRSVEWVYPDNHDLVHGQHLYRPDNLDVDLYQFEVTETGVLFAETFAERRQGSSTLDTSLVLYRNTAGGPEKLSSNEDLYGDDSAIELRLQPGTYFIGVTSEGNGNFNPTIEGSGSGGDSEGAYDLRIHFTPEQTSAILDAAGTPLDGDADGVPGGNFNFWFNTASESDTLFVDAAASLGGDGSAAAPFREIDQAISTAQPGQIVRIVGNPGDDGAFGTPSEFTAADDNLAYEIGRIAPLNQDLDDGRNLIVPKDVTVMIDAGSVFKMLGSRISVGSGIDGIDASGGVLQVLGTPHLPVFFTSLNDPGVGLEQSPLSIPPRPGDWGGIDFRSGVDRGEGRFDPERQGLFLNYVGNADMRYGGGAVDILSTPTPIAPIRLDASRPTLIGNRLSFNAGPAISADPSSFEETRFTELRYQRDVQYVPDYSRVGPVIYANRLIDNSTNGLLIRVDTPAGGQKEELTVAARFDDQEVVHILGDNLLIRGNPGGAVEASTPEDLTLVTLTPQVPAAPGGLTAGDYVYKISYVDEFGVETEPSNETGTVTVADGQTVLLDRLPEVNAPFVSRRLYRAIAGSNDFRLIADLNRASSTFVDDIATPTNVQPVANPAGALRANLDARLTIDAGIVIKANGVNIETGFGANLIAEGTNDRPIIFTSRSDDRYGAGGSFDTNQDGDSVGVAGDWGGIYASPFSQISIDHTLIAFGGGTANLGGTSFQFNAIELHQAVGRITNTTFESNAAGTPLGTGPQSDQKYRVGRGPNEEAVIFVSGSQPIIIGNTFLSTEGDDTAAISINTNALHDRPVADMGRQTGRSDLQETLPGNVGPLLHGNRLSVGGYAGLLIRPEVIATGVVFDDTDITHIVANRDVFNQPVGEILVPDLHTYGGLRLQSRHDESLVVKFENGSALTANGQALDIEDRIGGILQVLGTPGFPVILTSLHDDSVGAGLDPFGQLLTDTDGQDIQVGPGDWRGIELLEYAHDRNVETIRELEGAIGGEGDLNGTVGQPQTLGQLASGEKASDENLRLGFTVHGSIASAGDADVYSFQAFPGTVVWFDIDRTDAGLNSVVELVDGLGNVLARSDDSHTESIAGAVDFAAPGIQAFPIQQLVGSPTNSINGTLQDLYTLNPLDAGLRVVLPGTTDNALQYFVRVTGADQSSGLYQMQVRLRQQDEFGGSTVRHSDIRYAENGILVQGHPKHSPLAGEPVTGSGNSFNLGNIGETDRGAISVSGTFDGNTLNRYQFEVRRDQSVGPDNEIGVTFDIDYGDGPGALDTTLFLYSVTLDGNGQIVTRELVMTSQDSNIASDQPRPGEPANDITDLSRGSFGTRDPFLGTVELPRGNYELVVVPATFTDSFLNQYFLEIPNETDIRLEPIPGIQNIVDPVENGGGLFNTGNPGVPRAFGDTTLYITGDLTYAVNPQIGDVEATLPNGNFGNVGDPNDLSGLFGLTPVVSDTDGRRFGLFPSGSTPPTDADAGGVFQIDDTGRTVIGSPGIQTFEVQTDNNGNPVIAQADVGMVFSSLVSIDDNGTLRLFGLASRGDDSATFEQATFDAMGNLAGSVPAPSTNFIYELDPTTAQVINPGVTVDRAGNAVTNGAGTNDRELGRLATNQPIVAMVRRNNSIFAIAGDGTTLSFPTGDLIAAANGAGGATFGNPAPNTGDGSATLVAVAPGPRDLPVYEELLFALFSDNRLFAFDTNGQPASIFGFGEDFLQLSGISGPVSMGFGTSVSEWVTTTDPSPRDQIIRFSDVTTQSGGGFGATQGQMESNAIDLSDFSPADAPTLYFDYQLETFNASDPNSDPTVADDPPSIDVLNLYVSSAQSPHWQRVSSNDLAQSARTLYDTSNWRQARLSLANWAGHQDVRIRFDFNSAGETEINALELRAVSAESILSNPPADRFFSLRPRGGATQHFEFDFGLVLQLPSGPTIQHGSTITLQNVNSGVPLTLTFLDEAIDPTTGPLIVSYQRGMTAEQIANALSDQLALNGLTTTLAPTTPAIISVVDGTDPVRLTAAVGLDPAIAIEQPGVAAGRQAIPIDFGMDEPAIRDRMRDVIANAFNPNPGNPPVLDVYQTFGDSLRMFGVSLIDNGPLRYFGGYATGGTLTLPDGNGILPGSNLGVYRGTDDDALAVAGLRETGNDARQVLLDNFIIGSAERGEVVLGPTLGAGSSFINVPRTFGSTRGNYQLEIRLSPETLRNPNRFNPNLIRTSIFERDENDEPNEDRTTIFASTNTPQDQLIAWNFVDDTGRPIGGARIPDGATLRLSDGIEQILLEFDDVTVPNLSGGVSSGALPVPFTSDMTASEVAAAVRDAINRPEVRGVIGIRATSLNGNGSPLDDRDDGTQVLLHGPSAADQLGSIEFAVDPVALPIQVIRYGLAQDFQPGQLNSDANRHRDQGQLILQSNVIVDSSAFGIQVESDSPAARERQFLSANPDQLIPGVVIVNNILAGNTLGGVTVANSGGGTNGARPFTRIVNNTIYGDGSGVGINLGAETAATLLNNAVVNFATGIQAPNESRIVIEQTLFAENVVDAPSGLGNRPIVLPIGSDPVFANAANRNFYPIDVAGVTDLIDSGDSGLNDRPDLQALRNSLGIASSPILAPLVDLTGQTRIDDPDVNPGSGTGEFDTIDRGALDRSDFFGPTARLVNPLDNDSEGVDIDDATTFVRLESGQLREFVIKLEDLSGTGTNDASVLAQTVVLTEDGRRLIPGIDYTFGYSTTSNTIVLTPSSGVWSLDSVYEITLNNRDRIVGQMTDGLGVVDGQQFLITDDQGTTATFEYDSGVVLEINGPISEGDLIRYSTGLITVQFEFDSDGNTSAATSQTIPFSPLDTAQELATKIAFAMSTAGIGLEAARSTDNGLIYLGGQPGDTVDLISTGLSQISQPGVSSGAIAIPFIPSASFTADTMAGQAVAAITASGLATTVFAPGGGTIWLDRTDSVDQLEAGPIGSIRDVAGNSLEPNRANRETQFTIIMPNIRLDFGDAPSRSNQPNGYLTTLAENGPRHTVGISQTPRLGGLVDTEQDAQVGRTDDAVSDLTIVGSSGFIITSPDSTRAIISIAPNVVAGDRLTIDVAGTEYEFELVLAGTITPAIEVLFIPEEPIEVLTQRLVSAITDVLAADAPEVSVAHTRDTTTFSLASLDDEEGIKIGSVDFNGNTLDGVFFNPQTGDLISFLNPLANLGSEFIVETTGGGLLDGWVDFNGDGDFTDPGEQVLTNQPVFDGLNTLTIHTPPVTLAGNGVATTWSRFRLTSTGNTLSTGVAIGGEVEDHEVLIASVALPAPSDDDFVTDEDVLLVTGAANGVGQNDTIAGTISDVRFELEQTTANGTLNFDPLTGAFTYLGAEDFYGEDFFTYRITGTTIVDGVELPLRSAERGTVRITVNPVNDEPFAGDATFTTTEPTDTSPAVPLVISASDLINASLPQDDADARFAPWDEKEQTLRVVQISVQDNQGGYSPLVGMTDPFTAIDGVYSSDTYVNGIRSGFLSVNVLGGEVSQLTYTPADDYNRDNPQVGGLPSFDGFRYVIADDGATTLPNGNPAPQTPEPKSNEGLARIEVKPQNDAPTANNDVIDSATLLINEDVSTTIPASLLLANDFAGVFSDDDESLGTGGNDGTLQILSDANLPAGLAGLAPVFPITTTLGGMVDIDPSGDLVYTPPTDYYGPDSFTYMIVDQGVDEDVSGNRVTNPKVASAQVSFDVQPINDVPGTTDKDFTTTEDTPITISASQLLAASVAHGNPQRPAPFNENVQSINVVSILANGVTIDANTAPGDYRALHGSINASFSPNGFLSSLTYTPDPDFNADNPLTGGSRTLDEFRFTIQDDGVTILPGNTTITLSPESFEAGANILVTPQNDVPVAGTDLISADSTEWNAFFGGTGPAPVEDTQLQIPVAFLLANDSAAPSTATDELIPTNNNDGSISVVQGIYTTSLGGTVVVNGATAFYTPAPDVYGTDVFTYDLIDSGIDENTQNQRSQNRQTGQGIAEILLAPVNDAPNGRGASILPIESGEPGETVVYQFTAQDILFRGPGTQDDDFAGSPNPNLIAPFNESAQTLQILEVRTSPTEVANRANIPAGSDTITLNTPQGGTLELTFTGDFFTSGVYTPVNGDYNGRTPFTVPDSFQYVLIDDGLTVDPDGGPDITLPPETSGLIDGSFAPIATNDAPHFVAQPLVDILERDDNGGTLVNNWATEIRPGPLTALDELQRENVSFVLVESESVIPVGLFGRMPTVSPDGDLTIYPAPDAIGTAVLVFDAIDSDPRDSNFVPKTSRASVTVNIHAVNDPPRLDPSLLGTSMSTTPDDGYAVSDIGEITYTLPEDNSSATGDPQFYDFPILGNGGGQVGILDVFVAGPNNEIIDAEGGNQEIALQTSFPLITNLGGRVEQVNEGGLDFLRYFPPQDVNNVGGVTDSFNYLVMDSSVGNEETYSLSRNRLVDDPRSTLNRVHFNLTPVNDPPVFTIDTPSVESVEDGVESVFSGFVTNILAGPDTATDESNGDTAQNVTFELTPTNFDVADLNNLFSIPPTLTSDGTLSYQPSPDTFGHFDFSVVLVDDGPGLADGNRGDRRRSAPTTITLNIQPQNDAPVRNGLSELSYNILEDEVVDIPLVGVAGTLGLFDIFDVGPTNEADPTQLPGGGQTLSFADPVPTTTDNGGTLELVNVGGVDYLRYTPRADYNGMDSFTYTVIDDGVSVDVGTGSLEVDDFMTASASVTFDLTAVNDAPRFTGITDVNAQEDGPPVSLPGWASGVLAAARTATDEINGTGTIPEQNLTFVFTQVDGPTGLFSQLPSASISGSVATLNFATFPEAFGEVTFEVFIQDDGPQDGAIGDTFQSDPQTFRINISGVNDPPSFDAGSDVTVNEDSGAYQAPWATNISVGPDNELAAGQTVLFEVVTPTEDGGLFAVAPAIDSDGVLTFTPEADAAGSSQVSVRAVDSEGGASPAVTLTITIVQQSDPPIAIDDTILTDEDSVLTIESSDLLANDIDADLGTNPNEQLTIFADATTTTSLGATLTFDSVTGTFVYDATSSATLQALTDGESATDSFTYEIEDADGETPRPSATVTLNISGINDAPTVVDDLVALNPSGPTLIRPLDNDSDIDGTIDPSSIIITDEPTAGFVTILGDGTLTYTPNAAGNGTDGFRYTVADDKGQQSPQALVQIGEGPFALDVFAGTSRNRPVDIDLLASVSGGGTVDPTSVVIVNQPSNGTLLVGDDGVVRYTPNTDFVGEDEFTFTIANVDGLVSNPSTVRLRVVNSNLQNPMNFSDVNADGNVTAFDALLIVNRLNRAGNASSVPVDPSDVGPNFYDQNGDMAITAQDALLVINQLNRQSSGTFGEGESVTGVSQAIVGPIDASTTDPSSEDTPLEYSPETESIDRVIGHANSDDDFAPFDELIDQLVSTQKLDESVSSIEENVDELFGDLF